MWYSSPITSKAGSKPPADFRGFTLLEMLISLALLGVLSLMLVKMTSSTADIWRFTGAKIEQFQSATNAFESISRRLSQATLNPYWDYSYPNNDASKPPTKYFRQSDLRFISGPAGAILGSHPDRPGNCVFFQAPLGFVQNLPDFGGLSNLLNTWGYYVEFNKETRPEFIESLPSKPPSRYRYRLMEFMQPSEAMSIYRFTSGAPQYSGREWFLEGVNSSAPPVHMVAENVLVLVLLPKLSPSDQKAAGVQDTSLAPSYLYDSTVPKDNSKLDSKNQLPPVVQMTMVALDEASAARLSNGATPPSFDNELAQRFQDAANYEKDFKWLQDTLIDLRVSFRTFTTNVNIRNAKWSRN